MDFFAVGQRRSAFLVAAPAVARHDEYRAGLHRHLLDQGVGVRHWDPAMRELASQSLRLVVEADVTGLLEVSVRQLVRRCARCRLIAQIAMLSDKGTAISHGALLALAELAALDAATELRPKVRLLN